jgi:hypothetical protein
METLRIKLCKGIRDTMAEKGLGGGKLMMYRDKRDWDRTLILHLAPRLKKE